VPADKVIYEHDIKDATKSYTFTDGVKHLLKYRYDFSVLQICYGDCKDLLSVDPNLDNQKYLLKIRGSMNRFTNDRSLYLNRQDIALLESRDISHTTFLCLRNEYHLWLIRCLLIPSIANSIIYKYN
ncbi:unnamed protein product, partial [Rotaria sp. Silwood1]